MFLGSTGHMYDNVINMCEKISTKQTEDLVHANNAVQWLMSHPVAEVIDTGTQSVTEWISGHSYTWGSFKLKIREKTLLTSE